jgi:hypothetical protein
MFGSKISCFLAEVPFVFLSKRIMRCDLRPITGMIQGTRGTTFGIEQNLQFGQSLPLDGDKLRHFPCRIMSQLRIEAAFLRLWRGTNGGDPLKTAATMLE